MYKDGEIAIEKGERIIVEIGVRDEPFPATGRRMINAGEHYIGVERHCGCVPVARRSLIESQGHPGVLQVVQRDASKMDFLPDESVDEVVICNVFGEDYEFAKNLQGPIDEVERVLKPDGSITIVETSTPLVAPRWAVRQFFNKRGFRLITSHADAYELEKIWAYKDQYFPPHNPYSIRGDGYQVVFKRARGLEKLGIAMASHIPLL